MGNEISIGGHEPVEAKLQFNDIRTVSADSVYGASTAFVSVDNSAEVPLKRAGEPLTLRETCPSEM